jgi:hypothetical protein
MKSYDIDTCELEVSKHFRNKYMRRWNWDFIDLREAIRDADEVHKVGKKKYDAYLRKRGSKKIVFVYYSEFNTIFVITGSEGK